MRGGSSPRCSAGPVSPRTTPRCAFADDSGMILSTTRPGCRQPTLTAEGGKRALEWEEAVTTAADNLQRISAEGKGIGFIVSPRVTNEELFLISEIAGLCKKAKVASSAYYHTGKTAAAFRKRGMGFPVGYDRPDGVRSDHRCRRRSLDQQPSPGEQGAGNRQDKGGAGDRRRSPPRVACADRRRPSAGNAGRRTRFCSTPSPGGCSRTAGTRKRRKGSKASPNSSACSFPMRPPLPQHRPAVKRRSVEKASELIRDAGKIGVVFGSGISDRDESLEALLNFCLLIGLPGRGTIIPTALQANARGASAILDPLIFAGGGPPLLRRCRRTLHL